MKWCRAYCAQHGHGVEAEFSDEGIPGSEVEQREQLQALLAFCKDRSRRGPEIRGVVVWSIDRLSRASSLRTSAILDELAGYGVRYIHTNSRVFDLGNNTDLLLLNVGQDFGAEQRSRSISEDVSRRLLSKAKAGTWPVGKVPYGYRLGDDGRLVPGPEDEVATVRLVFSLYLSGLSMYSVARELNRL